MKCGYNVFELVESSPLGSNFKFLFLQCAKCGGVAGALDYLNIGSVLTEQSRILRKIAAALEIDIESLQDPPPKGGTREIP
jgi:hypothetical protein